MTVALIVGVFVPVARSQTLTWGANGGGGTGMWDTTTDNWFNGSAAVPWTQGDGAIFGGAAGTVTLGTTITAQDLTFQKDGYTITSNTLTLGVSSTPTVTLGAGISATISSIVAGSNGLTVTGGGTLTLTGANTYSGGTTINAGTLTYSGAASSSGGGNLNVASAAGNTAVVNFNSSGTLTFNTAFNVGASGGAGAVNQTAGTVNALNAPFIYIEIGNGAAGTYGSYVLSGGSLITTGASGIRVGDGIGGIGIFTQTGGTLSLSRYFAVAANVAGDAPVGVATFTGGTATVASGFQFLVGDSNGTGVLNLGTQAGGMAVLTSQNSSGFLVTNGNVTTGSGTLNLNSGVLNQTAGSINKAGPAGATAVVNFNGGTLQAGANNLTLIDNTLNSVNVYNGGAVFDTNGFTATVSANLRQIEREVPVVRA
jgi:autotransporter-associated beta strand protein